MLYYRTKQTQGKKRTNAKKSVVLFGVAIWLFWFGLEMPILAFPPAITTPSTNAMITEGTIVIPDSTTMPSHTAGDGDFTEPAIGVLTSPYGERWGRFHEGIDIGGESDSDILAADCGIVSVARWLDGYGNYIEIDHGNGFKTAYAHCNALYINEGDSVTQGQLIASMGSTGNSTGPHLHFEVLLHGEPQNPLDYVMY